ncbi:MAG: hypothetical protein FRX48_07751 [Lasallia pustulata]|uniref:Uncharacterized protein n=1 Tax=Lasallia pustulata TaxID=136370 RepID=A0A5M8PGZ2_9LECA|nr:MAG: hypothetical protein FRX48_07751 [Lasallia pustulata]
MAERDFDDVDASAEDDVRPPSPKRVRTQPPPPWHHNNYALEKLSLDELAAEGILDDPNAHFGDLSNPIHPLFHNFLSYGYLHPALRLASLFITQLECLPFYLALLTRPYDRLPELEKELQGPCYRFTLGPQPPKLRSLEQVRILLQMTTQMINIAFSPVCPKTAWAVCYRRPEAPRLARLAGTSSSIAVSPDFQQVLDPSYNPKITTSQRLRLSYVFAATLAHEIAHALRNARVRPPPVDKTVQPPREVQDYEPFFEDQRRAEVGHAWESMVIGGKLIDLSEGEHSVAYGLYIEKWPNIDDTFIKLPIQEPRLIAFQGRGLVVPPRTHIVAVRRRRPKKWTTIYCIPMAFIQQLFIRRFWEERVAKEGPKALRFEKRLGVRTANYEWEPGEDPGMRTDDSSWERWPDVNGVIRIGQPRLASPVVEEFGEDDWTSDSDEYDGDLPLERW